MQNELICYKKMPIWTKDSLPKMFQEKHNTKVGTWGKITVLKSQLKFYVLTEDGNIVSEHVFTPNEDTPFVEPQLWHRVEALSDDLECFLEFYCTKEDYFSKKYNMTATHGDVVNAAKIIKSCKVLDLGCGQGRNSLYLSLLGYDVTSWDHNENSLMFLNETKEKENLKIQTALYNINDANIQENYDFIVSTVVFMFLDRTRVPVILENM